MERLCLEEALLRHDPKERSWAIVGAHDPTYHTRLKVQRSTTTTATTTDRTRIKGEGKNNSTVVESRNDSCIIIMGIGGKPHKLLNMENVARDNVLVVKRFSGGGTVVVDHSSLWTTFIGRENDFPHVQPFPRDIMKWSADEVFGPAFSSMKNKILVESTKPLVKKTMVVNTKSCGTAGDGPPISVESSVPMSLDVKSSLNFALRENDYVLGEKKMGGNAQSIVKGGWLHHTSFLWDYDNDNMSEYLLLPEKRPDYRGNRVHDDFLVKLGTHFGGTLGHLEGKHFFFEHVKDACVGSFDLEEVSLEEALEVVDNIGGMQKWYEGKCRTRVVS